MSYPVSSANKDIIAKKSVVDYKKSHHRRRILMELYRSDTRSIAEMARAIHNSVPSVTSIMEELMAEKWIVTTGTATTKQGRKPAVFSLSDERFRTAVIDLNTHGTTFLVLNLKNEILFQRTCDLRLNDSPDILHRLTQSIESCIAESGTNTADLVAMGVSMAGLVDSKKGFNFTYRNLNRGEQSLMNYLNEYFKIPVFGINDTRATTLGEQRFGLAKGKNHVLAIYIDWGVGLGVILNGEIFQGSSGFAGELGHIQVVPNGELCHCGKVGCLDTIASAESLAKRVSKALAEGRVSRLSTADPAATDAEKIIEAAWQGDLLAIDVLHDMGMELGKGLSIAIHLFNPEIVIVDGIVAKAGTFITNPIEQAINKFCLTDFRSHLKVEISQLGVKAKWLGTQVFTVEKLIESVQ
ncbi:MAG: ROK family protein [Spirosomaceae bacterium]|nr:ROK family protein [Spirosomataceae bacterium]